MFSVKLDWKIQCERDQQLLFNVKLGWKVQCAETYYVWQLVKGGWGKRRVAKGKGTKGILKLIEEKGLKRLC